MKKFLLILVLSSGYLLQLACNPILITPKGPTPTPTITLSPTQTSTITMTPTITATPCTGQFMIGTKSYASGEQLSAINAVSYERFSPSQGGNVLSLIIYAIYTGYSYEAGIYSDNGTGSSPLSLLGTTEPQVINTIGYQTVNLNTPVSINSGSQYWFALCGGGMVGMPGAINPFTATGVGTSASLLPISATSYDPGGGFGAYTISGIVCP